MTILSELTHADIADIKQYIPEQDFSRAVRVEVILCLKERNADISRTPKIVLTFQDGEQKTIIPGAD